MLVCQCLNMRKTVEVFEFAVTLSLQTVLGRVAIHDCNLHPQLIVEVTRDKNRQGRFADSSLLVGEGNGDGVAHLKILTW